MRAVWIDKGNNPYAVVLQKYGVKRDYFDVRDASRARFAISRGRHAEVGVYVSPGWFPGQSLGDLVRLFSQDLTDLGVNHEQCAVHANIEHGDHLSDLPGYVVAFVKAFRALRPLRELAWVVDGLQGGLFTVDLLTTLSYYNVSVVAEAYTGSMAPLSPDEIRSNLVNFGVDRARALVMYDAATLKPTTYWDGCAFTQGRLAA